VYLFINFLKIYYLNLMSFNFNLYEELGINKQASQEEIKKAYKKLAMVINFMKLKIFFTPFLEMASG
jgi:preprotein translocase subunit Sec63